VFHRHRETNEAMFSGSRFDGSILCKKIPEWGLKLNKENYVANDRHQKLELIVLTERYSEEKWPLLWGSFVYQGLVR